MMFILSCDPVRRGKNELDKLGTTKILKSTKGKSQLTIPIDWREAPELNIEAELLATSPGSEMYVAIISQGKQDYAKDMTLDQVTALTRNNHMKKMTSPEATTPMSLVIGGYPARQYEVRGTVEGVNLVFINTTVETPNNYYHIAAWTLPSKFEKNQSTLQEVTQSFSEVDTSPPQSSNLTPTQPSAEANSQKQRF
jgi:hypothetical protein